MKDPEPQRIPTFLRPSKAAKLLDCGRSKIYDLIHRGEIKVVKIGGMLRIDTRELERLASGSKKDWDGDGGSRQ
jgi:excisionase family DNA binding protein